MDQERASVRSLSTTPLNTASHKTTVHTTPKCFYDISYIRSLATAEIVRIGSHYTVQGNSRSRLYYQSKDHMGLLDNTNRHPISHHFAVIMQY